MLLDLVQRLLDSDGFLIGFMVGGIVGAVAATAVAFEAGKRRMLREVRADYDVLHGDAFHREVADELADVHGDYAHAPYLGESPGRR